MSSFSDLPTELTTDILATAIPQHPNPSHILAVNRCFNDIGQFIIYTSLRFKSESQLTTDASVKKLLPHSPHSISVRIPGGQGSGVLFEGIKHVFGLCAGAVGTGILVLDSLEFCLRSHTSDPAPWKIGEALNLVNPRKFVWTGPDPPHHFPTVIVPYATYHLFQSIKAWSNLRSLTLTNISFPSRSTLVPVRNADEAPFLPLETLTNLRSVYIGQATLVPVRSIAILALARPKAKHSICKRKGKDIWYHEQEVEGRDSGLREIRLVDAYKESIWQERIHRKDLEAVAMEVVSSDVSADPWYHTPTGEIDSEAVLGRIREIISCEALTEHIMGGDRAEGMTTLV
ncbi:hypothetical protein BDM02DRAFT_3146388 [Thelephora ganbajun]|uniref:Uncharacterized protein n=1 Tax=Thelephora ganbajun TaxID=370292 RepID=A0ACB6ZC49_THEGA|nr:hypothetical protein BDM02DRAFT_3146388 [Thelephora ganbajun]